MAVMASRVIQAQRNKKKSRLGYKNTNKYDGYAVFCDKDRVKIRTLLTALKLLGLRVHCKDDADLGDRTTDAVTNQGIFASKCCLLFVSNNFTEDSFCMFLLDLALLQYVNTDRKYKIITIYLDKTKISYLGLFREITIKKFSCGTLPEIVLDERLLTVIYNAMKGPNQKSFWHNPKKYCCHVQYSLIKKRTRNLLYGKKDLKSAILKYSYISKGCQYVKLITLGYLICKCFLDSVLWIKLINLVTCPQIRPMIEHYLSKTIEQQIQLSQENDLFLSDCEMELQETKQAICKYCHSTVPASELNEHENECCKPVNCDYCGWFISQAHKKKHERRCIFEECFNCSSFHPSSSECYEFDSQITGILEESEQCLQDDFSSLTCEVSVKYVNSPEVTNTIDQLLEVVNNSFKKKKKKKTDDQVTELSGLVDLLLKQLKDQKVIDQFTVNMITEIMSKELVSMEYSNRSINFFRNFIYAVELHCNFPLFDGQPVISKVMSFPQPEPKSGIFKFFQKIPSKKNPSPSKEVFFPLVKDLFK